MKHYAMHMYFVTLINHEQGACNIQMARRCQHRRHASVCYIGTDQSAWILLKFSIRIVYCVVADIDGFLPRIIPHASKFLPRV